MPPDIDPPTVDPALSARATWRALSGAKQKGLHFAGPSVLVTRQISGSIIIVIVPMPPREPVQT